MEHLEGSRTRIIVAASASEATSSHSFPRSHASPCGVMEDDLYLATDFESFWRTDRVASNKHTTTSLDIDSDGSDWANGAARVTIVIIAFEDIMSNDDSVRAQVGSLNACVSVTATSYL